jgi:hypothetical protein
MRKPLPPIPTVLKTDIRRMVRARPEWPEYQKLWGIASNQMRRGDILDFLEYVDLFGVGGVQFVDGIYRLLRGRQRKRLKEWRAHA